MRLLSLFLMMLFLPGPASAANGAKADEGQLMIPPPMLEPAQPDGSRCFKIVNRAPYTVNGTLLTNYKTDLMGRKGRDVSNFRLAPGGEKKYCTFGPYYPGTRIGFQIRTIVPVFSCYTVAQGTIEVQGKVDAEGKTKTWVNCQ
jgi:hypothetical protein